MPKVTCCHRAVHMPTATCSMPTFGTPKVHEAWRSFGMPKARASQTHHLSAFSKTNVAWAGAPKDGFGMPKATTPANLSVRHAKHPGLHGHCSASRTPQSSRARHAELRFHSTCVRHAEPSLDDLGSPRPLSRLLATNPFVRHLCSAAGGSTCRTSDRLKSRRGPSCGPMACCVEVT